eukprot:365950-Amphidinium_carterae.1
MATSHSYMSNVRSRSECSSSRIMYLFRRALSYASAMRAFWSRIVAARSTFEQPLTIDRVTSTDSRTGNVMLES